jgi:reverse gyrase
MIVTMPTGSGKTWIQGIIAKHFCSIGKKVAIIEPSDELKIQTEEKVGAIDYAI